MDNQDFYNTQEYSVVSSFSKLSEDIEKIDSDSKPLREIY